MKTPCIAVVLLASIVESTHGLPVTNDSPVSIPPPSYVIGERGPNHRMWQKVATTMNALGQPVTLTNLAYLELATGMHYRRNGQWVESKEEIVSIPQGGCATNGPHTVFFATDLDTSAAVNMRTPDGKDLLSHILGLSYFDTTSGSNVLIAEIKSSQGVILPPNQVLYEDAFTDFKADVLYTYTRAGFEQNVIVRERPPTPEFFGLSSASSTLQVLTEFSLPPTPGVSANIISSGAGGTLMDQFLDFGAMKMGPGKAFMTGQDQLNAIPVAKEWATFGGRTCLIEQVAVAAIADQLNQLPPTLQASLKPRAGSVLHAASNKRLLPERKPERIGSDRMKIASLTRPERGLVIDYTTLNVSVTNYTFQTDTNYFISGSFLSAGTNTFEGGAVLKFATNGSVQVLPTGSISPRINWKAGLYRPVIFTAKDDNSIGENITGSTGNPATNYYGDPMLYIAAPASPPTLTGFRMAYGKLGLYATAGTYNFYDAQFMNCQIGLSVGGGVTALLGNALFSNTKTNLSVGPSTSLSAQNVTFNGSLYLASGSSFPDCGITLTNCILSNVTNLFCQYFDSTNGNYNGFYNSPYDSKLGSVMFTNTSNPFQTAGGGSFYLSEDSILRNSGIDSINSAVLAELRGRTTYPPIVYSAPATYYCNDLYLYPQAQRDTDTPDLGYHYDPLDYELGGMLVTNAIIKVYPGAALGMYGTNFNYYGIGIGDNAVFDSCGAPDHRNWIVEYSSVQEQASAGWKIPSDGVVWDNSGFVQQCRFTDWSVMAQDANHFYTVNDVSPINFQDCQFYGGKLSIQTAGCSFTNCLFERVNSDLEVFGTNIGIFRNNLFWGGTFGFYSQVTNSVIKDNLFDKATVQDWLESDGGAYDGGHNAYVTNYDRQKPPITSDVILTSSPAYQVGPLGRYYYPTNLSALINSGSVTNAGLVGLYHFTTTANQVKETDSIVDIGFHYVAVDSSGKPIDTDGDGIADYLEDANGDGDPTGDPSSWQSYNSTNGLVTGSGLIVFTPLK